ncbi:MAG: hypothetical protein IJ141_06590 [Lachnospiraceae bacterium]|nr:hypothetical protein [Lachnospiraceae bacterium]
MRLKKMIAGVSCFAMVLTAAPITSLAAWTPAEDGGNQLAIEGEPSNVDSGWFSDEENVSDTVDTATGTDIYADDTVLDETDITVKDEEGIVYINETNFPDAEFRRYLETYGATVKPEEDENGNKYFYVSDVEFVRINTEDAEGYDIKSLKGIELFTELKSVDIFEDSGSISALDLSQNTMLNDLYIHDENVKSIKLPNVSEITLSLYTPVSEILCDVNTKISLNTTLTQELFDCLPYENLTKLEAGDCNIDNLDLSACKNMEEITLYQGSIKNLKLGSMPKLKSLSLSKPQFASVDLSGCPELTYLALYNSDKLASLDLSALTKLATLDINGCKNFSSLDISKNTNLTKAWIYDTAISSLDVSNNKSLEFLNLSYTNIDSINIDGTALATGRIYIDTTQSIASSDTVKHVGVYVGHNLSGTFNVGQIQNFDTSYLAGCDEDDFEGLPTLYYNTETLVLDYNFENAGKSFLQIPEDERTWDYIWKDLDNSNVFYQEGDVALGWRTYLSIEQKEEAGDGWLSLEYDNYCCTYGDFEVYKQPGGTLYGMHYVDGSFSDFCPVTKDGDYYIAGYPDIPGYPYAKVPAYLVDSMGSKYSIYEGNTFYKNTNGDVICEDSDGNRVINEFKCDGTYTYYFQLDGTAMKDRLSYHPDGEHVIYFDAEGHEVFSDFANVKKTIAGEDVNDFCFFNVFGYMYVDVLTYDKTGTYLYYANPYGVMEMGKWFQFSDSVEWADGTPAEGIAGGYGYAQEDGTLLTNTQTTDWEGRSCYLQGNGVAAY